MDIINLIISGETIKKTCFLCFELNAENNTIYENIVINGPKFNLITSLYNIVKDLLPSCDILFSQACDSCTNVVTKMYYIFKLHLLKKEIIEDVINCMNNEIPKQLNLQTKLTINLPNNEMKEECMATINNENISTEQYKSECVLLNKNIHSNSESVICYICGKYCTNPKALRAHLKGHFKKQCPYCNKELKTHSHFNKHLQNHKHQTPFKRRNKFYNCHTCSYRSQTKSDLEAHINKVHLNTKPYKCEKCLKGFYRKSNLTAHELTHGNLRMLICEVCGQNFMNKKTLAVHLRLHDKKKIFKCDICFRYFTTQSRRNEHMKRNHSKDFISCLFCDKKYTLKKELNNHVKRFHGNIQS